jgi:hypothetical protein
MEHDWIIFNDIPGVNSESESESYNNLMLGYGSIKYRLRRYNKESSTSNLQSSSELKFTSELSGSES